VPACAAKRARRAARLCRRDAARAARAADARKRSVPNLRERVDWLGGRAQRSKRLVPASTLKVTRDWHACRHASGHLRVPLARVTRRGQASVPAPSPQSASRSSYFGGTTEPACRRARLKESTPKASSTNVSRIVHGVCGTCLRLLRKRSRNLFFTAGNYQANNKPVAAPTVLAAMFGDKPEVG
jgi:hypothetical protein